MFATSVACHTGDQIIFISFVALGIVALNVCKSISQYTHMFACACLCRDPEEVKKAEEDDEMLVNDFQPGFDGGLDAGFDPIKPGYEAPVVS